MPIAKIEVLRKIVDSGLVCVIRADGSEQASGIADACVDGGVATVEITFTVPGASGVIEHLAKNFAGQGPLPQASLMPTSGVSTENVGKWIEAGAVAVGVGGNLTAGAKTWRLRFHH